MMIRLPAALMMSLAAAVATPAWSTPSDDCREAMHRKIDRLDALMRHGYSGPQGERLRDKRKMLTDLRAQCDSNPQAWKSAPS